MQALCEREGRVENKGSERREEEEDFSLLECPAQHFSLGQEVEEISHKSTFHINQYFSQYLPIMSKRLEFETLVIN